MDETTIDSEFLGQIYKGSWKQTKLKFISTTQNANQFSNSHITDSWTGYVDEIEKLGDSVLIEAGTDVINEPYTSRLRPLSDMKFLSTAKNITFINAAFSCFDTTKHGSAHQNAAVNAELLASQTTDSIIPQTGFINTIPVTWFPTFFNPIIKVNGSNIFNSSSNNAFQEYNRGDISIGELLPQKMYFYDLFEKINQDIEVYGSVRQLVKVGSDYYAKAYPLKVEIVITYA